MTTQEQTPLQRTRVEIANSFTHIFGALATIPAGWYIISNGYAKDKLTGLSMLIFSLGSFLLYTSSAIYHWTVDQKQKFIFRHFDHANIYVLIAASYTPIWLSVVGGTLGKTMCLILWFVALAGIIYKICALGKFPKLSLTIYLIMGWSVVFAIKPVWTQLSGAQLAWIFTEGIFYTVGTYFYSHKEKPTYHVIWHLFVLAGNISHYIAILPLVR